MMAKKEINVAYETNGYDRVKQGKLEHVRKYTKKIDIPELSKETENRIKSEKTKRIIPNESAIESIFNSRNKRKINLLLSSENFLGSGEFSDAYKINNLIIKVNREKSLYNPDFWKEHNFQNVSKTEMKSEIKTYNTLKKDYSDILPKTMKGYDINDHYYIIKEFGIIPIEKTQYEKRRKELIEKYPKVDPKEFQIDKIRITFPKWEKGLVKESKYNYFVKRLYDLGKDKGFFDDFLQPALREDGSLFLSDLGHFESKEKGLYGKQFLNKESEVHNSYNQINQKLKHLDKQLGIKHKYPKEVLEFYINYNQKEYNHYKNAYPDWDEMHKVYYDQLNKWKKIAQEKSPKEKYIEYLINSKTKERLLSDARVLKVKGRSAMNKKQLASSLAYNEIIKHERELRHTIEEDDYYTDRLALSKLWNKYYNEETGEGSKEYIKACKEYYNKKGIEL